MDFQLSEEHRLIQETIRQIARDVIEPNAKHVDETGEFPYENFAETDTFAGGLKMVEGALQISTTADPAATIEVPAGQCLTENASPADGAHPILGSFVSATCP